MCVLTAASEPHNLQVPFNAYAFLPITHSNSYAAVEWYTVLHIHVWPLPQGKGVRRICNAVFLYISFSGRRISGETLSVNGCEIRESLILVLGTAVRFLRLIPKNFFCVLFPARVEAVENVLYRFDQYQNSERSYEHLPPPME